MTGELIAQVDEALKSGLVSKDKLDFAVELLESLKGQDILFQDQVTGGILGTRLAALHRLVPEAKIRVEQCFSGQPFSITTADNCAQLLRVADNPHVFDITWRNKRRMLKARMELPFKSRIDSERGAKAATEWALYKLYQWSKE